MQENLRLTIDGLPVTDEMKAHLGEAVLQEGYGVFEHTAGIARMWGVTLRSVWRGPEAADGEATRLNEVEGRYIFEVDGDPESNVYDEVYFDTGRVALTGAELRLSVQATYERVE